MVVGRVEGVGGGKYSEVITVIRTLLGSGEYIFNWSCKSVEVRPPSN